MTLLPVVWYCIALVCDAQNSYKALPGLKETFKLVKSTICYRRNRWGLIAAGKHVQKIVRAEIVVLKLCSVGPYRGTCRFIK